MADQWDAAIASAHRLSQADIVALAKRKNAEVMAAQPRPLAVERHVDGVLNAPEEAVRPGGVIVYDYNRLDLVVEFALDTLRQLSPIDQGDYVRSHVAMLNGTAIGSTDSANGMQIVAMTAWKPGDRLTISNTMPYARKIEIGKKGYHAHGQVYEKAADIVNRRFGNMASVFLIYEKAPRGGGEDGIRAWAASAKGRAFASSQRGGSPAKHWDWLLRQPTLLIQEAGS